MVTPLDVMLWWWTFMMAWQCAWYNRMSAPFFDCYAWMP